MKRIVFALALVACHKTNDLELQLGPTPDTLSLGFECKEPTDASKYLFERAITNGEMKYSLAIDVAHLGAVVPSCAGEDIVAACPKATSCPIDAQRVCLDFGPIPLSAGAGATEIIAKIIAAWNALTTPLFADAPDGPVIVRVVAFTGGCQNGVAPAFTPANVLGCAFSCPEVLDDISGALTVQLQLLNPIGGTAACDAAVVDCAQFPNQPRQ